MINVATNRVLRSRSTKVSLSAAVRDLGVANTTSHPKGYVGYILIPEAILNKRVHGPHFTNLGAWF